MNEDSSFKIHLPYIQVPKVLRFLSIKLPDGNTKRFTMYHIAFLTYLSEMSEMYKSRSTIARELGISLTMVRNLIKELQYPIHETGEPLIVISKFRDRDNQIRNQYEVFPHQEKLGKWYDTLYNEDDGHSHRERWLSQWDIANQGGRAPHAPGGRAPRAPGVGHHVPPNEPNKNEPKNKEIHTKVCIKKAGAGAPSHTLPIFIDKPRENTRPIREYVHLTEEEVKKLLDKYNLELIETMLDKLNLQHEQIAQGLSKRKTPYTFSVFQKHSWLWDASTKTVSQPSTRRAEQEDFKSRVKKRFVKGSQYNQAFYDSNEIQCGFSRGTRDESVKWSDYEFEEKFKNMALGFGISC